MSSIEGLLPASQIISPMTISSRCDYTIRNMGKHSKSS